MSYFFKYLPVEGEIKENDSFYNPFIDLVKERADKEDISNIINANNTNCKKVKLFLCSTNILPEDYLEEGKVHIFIDDSFPPFKKIGSVSKLVEDVKENDTITEDKFYIDSEGIVHVWCEYCKKFK